MIQVKSQAKKAGAADRNALARALAWLDRAFGPPWSIRALGAWVCAPLGLMLSPADRRLALADDGLDHRFGRRARRVRRAHPCHRDAVAFVRCDRYRREIVSLAVLADTAPDWRPSGFAVGRWGSRLGLVFPSANDGFRCALPILQEYLPSAVEAQAARLNRKA